MIQIVTWLILSIFLVIWVKSFTFWKKFIENPHPHLISFSSLLFPLNVHFFPHQLGLFMSVHFVFVNMRCDSSSQSLSSFPFFLRSHRLHPSLASLSKIMVWNCRQKSACCFSWHTLPPLNQNQLKAKSGYYLSCVSSPPPPRLFSHFCTTSMKFYTF